MEYQLAFDLAQVGYRTWWFPALGLIGIFIGTVFFAIHRAVRSVFPKSKLFKFTSICLMGLSSLWTFVMFGITFPEYIECQHALTSGHVQIVEGPVTNFVPMPFEGHADESFEVQGHRFSYSDYGITVGFNNTSSHGGPIRAERWVRVTFVGNVIVKLEVAK